jgi:hypothetical protein
MKTRFSVLVGAASMFVATLANAGFDWQAWNLDTGPGGSGSLTDSLMSVAGGNGSSGGTTFYYTTASMSGTVSVDWLFNNTDASPGYDFIGYIVNGSWTDVSTFSVSGTISLNVNQGDVYGFGVRTTDGFAGAGFAEFTNFVPTPGAFAVLGLAGLTRTRRRR